MKCELDLQFIEAIARGWGLRFNCRKCAEYKTWTDAEMASRFLAQLDQKMSILRGRVSCPSCGEKDKLVIHPYNSGTMAWKDASKQISDMVATIEARKRELREMPVKQIPKLGVKPAGRASWLTLAMFASLSAASSIMGLGT